jgi:hypothetical protein
VAEKLSLDRPEVAHQAQILDTLATDLAGAIGPVLDNLAGLGDYCGTDQSGQSFAASYQPHVDRVEPALTDAVGDVSALAGALRFLAAIRIDQDDESAARFRAIGGAIPTDPVS